MAGPVKSVGGVGQVAHSAVPEMGGRSARHSRGWAAERYQRQGEEVRQSANTAASLVRRAHLFRDDAKLQVTGLLRRHLPLNTGASAVATRRNLLSRMEAIQNLQGVKLPKTVREIRGKPQFGYAKDTVDQFLDGVDFSKALEKLAKEIVVEEKSEEIENFILPLLAARLHENPFRAALAMMLICLGRPQFDAYIQAILETKDLPHAFGMRLFRFWHLRDEQSLREALSKTSPRAQFDFLRIMAWLGWAGLAPDDAVTRDTVQFFEGLTTTDTEQVHIEAQEHLLGLVPGRCVIRLGGVPHYIEFDELYRQMMLGATSVEMRVFRSADDVRMGTAQVNLTEVFKVMTPAQWNAFDLALGRYLTAGRAETRPFFRYEENGQVYFIFVPRDVRAAALFYEVKLTSVTNGDVKNRKGASGVLLADRQQYAQAFEQDFVRARIIRVSPGSDFERLDLSALESDLRRRILNSLLAQATTPPKNPAVDEAAAEVTETPPSDPS